MQLESRAPGYWLVHNVVPPIGLQIPLAPWVLSLAPFFFKLILYPATLLKEFHSRISGISHIIYK
jgi:tellurite resistance protein TehA-like permease